MTTMKRHIATTAAAMAVTALMAFQPMTAVAAVGTCSKKHGCYSTGCYSNGCVISACQSFGCKANDCRQNKTACRKNLSVKNCSSPKLVSYKISNLGCQR